MNRKIRRLFQWVLVVTLTTVLSASPVSAGWLLHKMHRHHHAAYCYVEPDPCPPVCPPPVCCPAPIDCCVTTFHESPVFAPPVIDHGCPCGCGEVVGSSAPMMESPMGVEPMMGTPIESFESSPPPDNWQPHDSGAVIQPSTEAPIESSSDVPPIVPTPIPAEPDFDALETDPVPTPETDPNAIDAPTEESDDAPAEDPFGAADAVPPAADEAPTDDLFGEPPADEAAPADSAPEDNPPAEVKPAEEKPAEDTSIDDLFGTDAATESAEPVTVEPAGDMPEADIFGEQPSTDVTAEPATGGEAATATETDSLDDLFGSEPATEASPAESKTTPESPASEPGAKPASEPASDPESNSIDDLFGDSPVDTTPAEVLTDDSIEALFVERTVETEADAADGASESTVEATSIDDRFGENPSDDAAAEESNAIEPTPSIEDLFGTAPAKDRAHGESFAELPAPNVGTAQGAAPVKVVAAEIKSADPLDSTHLRTWIDNSGTFSTEGRLIEIHRSSVRVLKSNGRTCTVPNERLSAADAAYVDSIRRQLDHPLFAMSGN